MKVFLKGLLAVVLCATMLFTQVACTQADTLKVVNLVIQELPTAISLAQVVLQIVGTFGTTGLDTGTASQISSVGRDVTNALQEVNRLANAYVAHPDKTVFQNLINVVDTAVQETDGQLLLASHIKDPATKQKVIVALAALSTALHVIDGYLLSRETPQQVKAQVRARQVKLQQIRSYLVQPENLRYADQRAQKAGTTFDAMYTWEVAQGF